MTVLSYPEVKDGVTSQFNNNINLQGHTSASLASVFVSCFWTSASFPLEYLHVAWHSFLYWDVDCGVYFMDVLNEEAFIRVIKFE